MSDLSGVFLGIFLGLIAGMGIGMGVAEATRDQGPSKAYQKVLIKGNHGYYDPITGKFTLREIMTISPGEAPFPGA